MHNLQQLIAQATAIRLRQRLLPEGGPADKIFPPTFSEGVYCWEQRRIEGQSVPCVLLDSVASQANRFEEALAQGVAEKKFELPHFVVRFENELADVGEISSLSAPHRVFDAIIRDTSLNGVEFSKTPIYRQLAACTLHNATELFARAPTALLFGCWDSTGAAGGLGNRFARAVTSEIVGIQAEWGATRGGVRRDPLNISAEIEIAIDSAGEWSLVGRSTSGKKDRVKGTRPAEINHGSVPLKVEERSYERLIEGELVSQRLPLKGGVTVDHALQTTVLSLAALRRLRFPVEGENSKERDAAARTVLAALGLVAIATAREQGYWLRSRCGLVVEQPQSFEIVNADGTASALELDAAQAVDLYRRAVGQAREAGLPWHAEPVLLKPLPKLVELIKKSREIQSLQRA